MEVYVTQTEFNTALKELKRLQTFLTNTFGSKFSDFKCNDDILEIVEEKVSPLGKDVSGRLTANGVRSRSPGKTVLALPNDVVCIDPLVERDDKTHPVKFSEGPIIVTSTKSLQKLPLVSSYTPPETITVPILQSNTVSVSSGPSVTITLSQNAKETTAHNGSRINPIERSVSTSVETPQSTASCPKRNMSASIHTKGKQSSVSKGTTQLQQTVKSTKDSTKPGDLQLRGRTFYQMTLPTKDNDSSTNNNASSNDSEPIPIEIETMDDVPTPPKRSRPPPLPSFRKRAIGLRSDDNKRSPAQPKAPVTSAGGANEIIQCDLCNLFVYSSQLDSHMKNHSLLDGKNADKVNPSMSKTQICPICSLKCTDYQMYEQHCANVHPDEGFPCPFCTRRMSSKPKLKRHMIIHRNLKFECKICGKAYNRSDNLSAHYKTHGDSQETSVYYCPACNMAFSSRSGRDKHFNCAHSERLIGQDSGSSLTATDSSENEAGVPNKKDSMVTVEKIKVEGSAKSQGIEFEYEGDDDDDDDGA